MLSADSHRTWRRSEARSCLSTRAVAGRHHQRRAPEAHVHRLAEIHDVLRIRAISSAAPLDDGSRWLQRRRGPRRSRRGRRATALRRVPSGGLPTWVVGERSSIHVGNLRPGPRKAMKATSATTAHATGNARGHRPKSARARLATRSSAGRYAAPAARIRPTSIAVPVDQAVPAARTIEETTTMTSRPTTITSAWATSQRDAGQGAGQPGLETARGLLAAQAARRPGRHSPWR